MASVFQGLRNVTVLDHPLIRHKLTVMRDKSTGTTVFRMLTQEIAALIAYEALRDLPLKDVEVQTPLETCVAPELAEKQIAIIPILRAGLGMADGVAVLLPNAKIGHIGMFRDPETHLPHTYFTKLPDSIDERTVLILDPMLATGNTAVEAVRSIRECGGKKIRFLSILSAPEGLHRLAEKEPDIQIVTACVDRGLNDHAYILPGLGDAGDRIFGTK